MILSTMWFALLLLYLLNPKLIIKMLNEATEYSDDVFMENNRTEGGIHRHRKIFGKGKVWDFFYLRRIS